MIANNFSKRIRRWLRPGPGTITAVVAVACVLCAGRLSQRSWRTPVQSPDRIVLEADAGGQLRRVTSATGQTTAIVPLWKPEPALLLQKESELKLDQNQRLVIRSLDRAWRIEKGRIERQIAQVTGEWPEHIQIVASGSHVSATQITERLKGYSELSREYNNRREDYWRQSLFHLTAAQQQTLSSIAATFRRAR